MSTASAQLPGSASVDAMASEFAHSKVLIIDDDPVIRLLLRGVANKMGIGLIVEAENGEKGLAEAERVKPDVVLLDIMMPGMSGFEVCRKLRAAPCFNNTAILIQTGLERNEQRIECFTVGASDVVSKPLNISELTARLKTHLRNALYAKSLAEFRERMNIHLELAKGFISSVLPDLESSQKIVSAYNYDLDVAHHPHEEIGGDLWYCLPYDEDQCLLVLVDASAHGVAGAMSALRIDSFLRESDKYFNTPGILLNVLDTATSRIPSGTLFAAITAILLNRHLGVVSYASSGNPPPILCKADGIDFLPTSGMPIGSGMIDNTQLDVVMNAGDSLIIHSDGWPGSETDKAALLNPILADGPLKAEIVHQQATKQSDDSTIMILRRK